MTKYYCDRCGKESEKLFEVKIPSAKLNDGFFRASAIQVCSDCKKEHTQIEDKLVEIRFILFRNYMKEGK